MSLGKAGKKNDEVRNWNSQLKRGKSDLKASMSALKKTLISGSHRTEIVKNQTQNHILQVVDLQADGIPSLPECLVLQ